VISGQALQIIGPNGCGKTSLLRILSGLTLPAAGQVYWGEDLIHRSAGAFRANLAYLGHRPGLKADLDPAENLKTLLNLGTTVADDLESEVKQGLDMLGISARQAMPCRQLSAGQKQRAGIARVMLQKVPLWILDEPATSLDQNGIGLLCKIMHQHLAQNGIIVFVSHQDFDLPAGSHQTLDLGESHG